MKNNLTVTRLVYESTNVFFSHSTENQPGDRLQDPSAEQPRPEEQAAERAIPVRSFATAGLQARVRWIRREQGTCQEIHTYEVSS